MRPLLEAWETIGSFIYTGGDVLLLIFGVTFLMWTLMLERLWYFRRGHREELKRALDVWQSRREQTSWYAAQIRRLLISDVSRKLKQGIPTIKTLIALCPLLGLLGTVTGMIEVFDVMAIAGSGNPRAMASGVSKATIPTMAGMVAALSGLFLISRLERFALDESEELASHLTHA